MASKHLTLTGFLGGRIDYHALCITMTGGIGGWREYFSAALSEEFDQVRSPVHRTVHVMSTVHSPVQIAVGTCMHLPSSD